MNIILNSNLHFRVIQSKLTPHLGSLTEGMEEELEYAVKRDFPTCDGMYETKLDVKMALTMIQTIGLKYTLII